MNKIVFFSLLATSINVYTSEKNIAEKNEDPHKKLGKILEQMSDKNKNQKTSFVVQKNDNDSYEKKCKVLEKIVDQNNHKLFFIVFASRNSNPLIVFQDFNRRDHYDKKSKL